MVGNVSLIIYFINKINFMLVFFSKLLTPKLKKILKLEKYDIINIQGVNRISFII